MFFKNFILFYFWTFFLQTENKRYLNEHKFLYLKPKQVSCDDININESDDSLVENLLIGNLSSCMSKKLNEHDFDSFSTQLNDQSIQTIFDNFFTLDDKTGLIYQRQNIDREKICIKKMLDAHGAKMNEFVFDASNSSLATDHFDCDCNSDICRLSLIFVAFKQTTKSDSRVKKNKFNHFSRLSAANNHIHKYLSLSINIKDVNDNRPFFGKNFLYLNITEQFGQNLVLENGVPSDNLLCNVLISNFDLDMVNNQRIALEKPCDPDSKPNSELIYKLILLSSQDMDLVEHLEAEMDQNKALFEFKLKNLVENFKENCFNRFELIENNLNQQLYLKVNNFLDREQRSVYNFILLILEKNFISLPELNGKNFLLFRLKINDLNDNQPKFDQAKYSFYLNEATDYPVYYQQNKSNNSIYFSYLQQICHNLKQNIKVVAHDLDQGLNAALKYNIIQQINRKNPNSKMAFWHNSIDAEFWIDQDGSIQLEMCQRLQHLKNLTQQLFLDLTRILDYELFHKHVVVVEAKDSNIENPLSTVVTVDINILDLNDHKPFVLSLYSKNCVYQRGLDLDISVQEAHSADFSTKIVLDGLSELSPKGSCMGQFLVKDFDTQNSNRQINGRVLDHDSGSLFLFQNLKNQNSTSFQNVQSNEIFELYLNFEPDAELQTVYNLVIELTDSGQLLQLKSRAELTLIIKDENDNDPKFDQDLYTFNIDEWNEFESNKFNSLAYCFARLEAHDPDVSQQHHKIAYSLEAVQPSIQIKNSNKIRRNKEESNFYIDQLTGYLCVKDRSLLDRETRSKYDFVVRASNQNATRFSQTSVQIVINDLNDNPPQFKKKNYTFYITEKYSNLVTSLVISDANNQHNLDKTFVGNIKAFDKDSLNAGILYFVDKMDQDTVLQLNTKNPTNPLLRDNHLLVIDENVFTEQKIFPENAHSYDSLIDNLPGNESIFYHVTAIKHDDSNAKLLNKKVFKLVHNLDQIIDVDPYTGDVYLLNSFIDREKILNIKFKVCAKDKHELDATSLKSWTNVTIEIDDINDSTPICYPKSSFLGQPNKSLERLALFFDYSMLELNQNYKMALIYEFNCIDLDTGGKNSDLKYEIEGFDLKSLDEKKGLDKNLVKKFNDFMKFFRIFKMDSSAGKFYVDLSSYWWRSDLAKFLFFVEKSFVIVKFRVSDDGIVSLSNYYQVELLICSSGSGTHTELCKFSGVEYSRPVLTKSILDYHYENLNPNTKDNSYAVTSTVPLTITQPRQESRQEELKKEVFLSALDLRTKIQRTTIESSVPQNKKIDNNNGSNYRVFSSIVNLLFINFFWFVLFNE
ncbi:protocadherin Fat 4 [Brachionus plicatilis]|uniref:Protocadherin Fat 4 n=1 Tax=Brachionus plicatilis TaxID=10195 RepID=A0A3M7TA26_BRAPC|nr:protocadherin Fat 4 [Brachionus plicatilis]